MSLASGTRIGPYEVTAQIGVGGMEAVYRAQDHKLQRDVAIKVLPEAFARDAERLARFEREARTLASLNHPNIAAIYGLEEGPPEAATYLPWRWSTINAQAEACALHRHLYPPFLTCWTLRPAEPSFVC